MYAREGGEDGQPVAKDDVKVEGRMWKEREGTSGHDARGGETHGDFDEKFTHRYFIPMINLAASSPERESP
jgi:hypothetical protein